MRLYFEKVDLSTFSRKSLQNSLGCSGNARQFGDLLRLDRVVSSSICGHGGGRFGYRSRRTYHGSVPDASGVRDTRRISRSSAVQQSKEVPVVSGRIGQCVCASVSVRGFVQKKQRHFRQDDEPNEVGDTWTFIALDADTRLIPSFRVGKRSADNTRAFIADLASRLPTRPQVTSDGLALYIDAIEAAFGRNVDYGQVIKSYEAEPAGAGRYSPPKVSQVEKTIVFGDPDLESMSTSYVERQNLTMSMRIRRMTRLTNAFSKTAKNHRAATALHIAHYNLVRRHQT